MQRISRGIRSRNSIFKTPSLFYNSLSDIGYQGALKSSASVEMLRFGTTYPRSYTSSVAMANKRRKKGCTTVPIHLMLVIRSGGATNDNTS